MSSKDQSIHGIWGRWIFILAATGSAVGLGNIWKFPYITGENGGGAFVLVYLLCISLVGIPIMIAEVALGRKGRKSPIHSVKEAANEADVARWWQGIGWMGALAGFFILSFYSVVAGWALAYIPKVAMGTFTGADSDLAGSTFDALLADPLTLLGWHSLFMVLTLTVIARGVNKGLEAAIRILMPLLFVLLLVLLGYSLSSDGVAEAANFMFSFDFTKLTWDSVLVALGHAFFTLSLGMGAIMAYGAYMPREASIAKTVITIGAMDTAVALVAGMCIFPIVFANDLNPGEGAGLMFHTLPLAFGQMPMGEVFGTLFFLLVAFAAWSSAISLAEPAVAWAVEKGFNRVKASLIVGMFAWILGIGSVLSLNEWGSNQFFVNVEKTIVQADEGDGADTDDQSKEAVHVEFRFYADVAELTTEYPDTDLETYTVKGKTVMDVLDFLTTNIMLPLGGLLIAIFVGWKMKKRKVEKELNMTSMLAFNIWYAITRLVAPGAVLVVFLKGLGLF